MAALILNPFRLQTLALTAALALAAPRIGEPFPGRRCALSPLVLTERTLSDLWCPLIRTIRDARVDPARARGEGRAQWAAIARYLVAVVLV